MTAAAAVAEPVSLPLRSLKVVVLGAIGVGKTALCSQFAFGVFPLDHERTVARQYIRTLPSPILKALRTDRPSCSRA